MKIRYGFVSNSSSSSFVIGVAEIPPSKMNEAIELFGEDNVFPAKMAEAASKNNWSLRYNVAYDRLFVDEGDQDSVSTDCGLSTRDTVVVVLESYGEEPEFDEDSWEYNYDDVDLDEEWFNERTLKRASFINEHGGEIAFGGYFNG